MQNLAQNLAGFNVSKRLFIFGLFCCICAMAMLAIPRLQYWDTQLLVALIPYRNDTLTLLTQTLAWLGGLPAMLVLTAVSSLLFLAHGQYLKIRLIVIAVLGSVFISWCLKIMVGRARPEQNLAIFQSYGDSFPSGHSLYAAALAALLCLLLQRHRQSFLCFALAAVWLVLIGLSRLYLGVHFVSDVLAGWALGLIWIALLWQYFAHKHPTFRLEYAHKLDKKL